MAKEFSVRFITPDELELFKKLKNLARVSRRSLSKQIIHMLFTHPEMLDHNKFYNHELQKNSEVDQPREGQRSRRAGRRTGEKKRASEKKVHEKKKERR